MRRFAFLTLFFVSSIFTFSQSPSRTFWITDNAVHAIAYDGSNYYIAGDFNYIGPNAANIAKITTTSTDPNLSYPNIKGDVYCMIPDGSGGIYIGGAFTKVGDSTRSYLAHITSTGSVDNWNPNPNGYVNALNISNGKLYVGGSFTRIEGIFTKYQYIARFDVSDGSLDTAWHPKPNSQVLAVVVNNSNIYLGGYFTELDTLTVPYLAKVNNTDGGVDTTWKPKPNTAVYSLVTDGAYLYCGGGFTTMQDTLSISKLARVKLSDGTTDEDWHPNPNGAVNSIIYNDPYLYLGGEFTSIGGELRKYAAKIDTSGSVSASWAPNINNSVKMVYLGGSYVYIGGQFTSVNAVTRYGLARLSDADATLDATWDPDVHDNNSSQTNYDGAVGTIYCMVKNSDDIIIGGRFITLNGLKRSKIAKISSNGEVDASWSSDNINGSIRAIAIDGNDIYIGGYFTEIGTTGRNRLAKLSASDGSLDANWNPSANYYVDAIVVTSDNVFCGGQFWEVNSKTRRGVVKIDKTYGTVDNDWKADVGNSETVFALAVDGSDIYVGGNFTSIDGESIEKLAKVGISSTGVVNTGWNPAPNSTVYSLAMINSNLYVGGSFTQIDNESISYFAKVNPSTGSVDNGWNPNVVGTVYSISEKGSDLLIGGSFTSVNGETHKYVAIINSSSATPLSSFAPNLGSGVKAVNGGSGGVLVGGTFTNNDNSPQPNLAFFSESALPVELVAFTGYSVSDGVVLSWQTATEINNYGFEIQRAVKGDEFETIGFVEGAGNSNSPKKYSFTDNTVESGKYSYRLKQIDLNGNYEFSKTIEINVSSLEKFELSQNYPNPFNPTTNITYVIAGGATRQANGLAVQLKVYDALGREVATLVNKKQKPGKYSVKFNAKELPSGVYFYTLQSGDFIQTRKMLLLK